MPSDSDDLTSMASVIANPRFENLKPVTINRSQLVRGSIPVIAAGDILRLKVRKTNADGQGTVMLFGQPMKAKLPGNVGVGDHILARVSKTEGGDQVILRILDLSESGYVSGIDERITPQEIIAAQIEQYVRNAGVSLSRMRRPMPLPSILSELSEGAGQVGEFFASVGNLEDLAETITVMNYLDSLRDGGLVKVLRDTAGSLYEYVDEHSVSAGERMIQALKAELTSLLLNSSSDNDYVSQQLNQLVVSLGRRIDEQRTADVLSGGIYQSPELGVLTSEQTHLLESVLYDLKSAQGTVEDLSKHIKHALGRFSLLHYDEGSKENSAMSAREIEQLRQVAISIEQIAATQRTLHQLNPLMQAMGEPALILFPFLFHGLLSHSEITIKPKRRGSGGSGGGSEDAEQAYHRVEVSVPLPEMGNVEVDIAHRGDELLVCFHVQSEEVAKFISEHSGPLLELLKQDGFARASFVTHVGERGSDLPAWTMGIHASASVLV
ncbi:hypothetical protein BVY02_00655 [bacterium J17]|nr:hypothetical protein BVY02_00655 [bacterium J17]